jgi:hypothetical protein
MTQKSRNEKEDDVKIMGEAEERGGDEGEDENQREE